MQMRQCRQLIMQSLIFTCVRWCLQPSDTPHLHCGDHCTRTTNCELSPAMQHASPRSHTACHAGIWHRLTAAVQHCAEPVRWFTSISISHVAAYPLMWLLPKRALAAMLAALPATAAHAPHHAHAPSCSRGLAACASGHLGIAQIAACDSASRWQAAADVARRLSSRGCSTRAAAIASPGSHSSIPQVLAATCDGLDAMHCTCSLLYL
jgi:hypothetical protein